MNNNSVNHSVYETFNKSSSRRTKRGGTRKNKQRYVETIFDPVGFMNIINSPDDYQDFYINYVRHKIMSLDKLSTKLLFLHLCICINDHNEYFHQYNSNEYNHYLAYLARDIAFAKLKSIYRSHIRNKKSKHFIVIDYCNKLMDNINFNKIINNIDIVKIIFFINYMLP